MEQFNLTTLQIAYKHTNIKRAHMEVEVKAKVTCSLLCTGTFFFQAYRSVCLMWKTPFMFRSQINFFERVVATECVKRDPDGRELKIYFVKK